MRTNQGNVLGVLARVGESTVSDIYTHLRINSSTARNILNSLESQGLVQQGARFTFSITAKGEDALASWLEEGEYGGRAC